MNTTNTVLSGAKDIKTVKLQDDIDFFKEASKKLALQRDIDLIILCASIGLYKMAYKHQKDRKNNIPLKKLTSITTFDRASLFDYIIIHFLNKEDARMDIFESYFRAGFKILQEWFDDNIQNLSNNSLEIFSSLIQDLVSDK